MGELDPSNIVMAVVDTLPRSRGTVKHYNLLCSVGGQQKAASSEIASRRIPGFRSQLDRFLPAIPLQSFQNPKRKSSRSKC